MWPILFCSILTLAISIERWLRLVQSGTAIQAFLSRFTEHVQNRQIDQAQQLCDQTPGLIGQVAKAGLPHYGKPRLEIREHLEETLDGESLELGRYIPVLGTIAHLAPLLGLLGTVTGLVKCFQTIQIKASSIAPVNPADLAGGIWEALLTTVFGLMVAIPTYALYNYFAHQVNQLVLLTNNAISPLTRTLSGEK